VAMMDAVNEARRPDWAELMKVLVITSREKDLGRSHEDIASAALKAGCRAVQLRDKEMTDRAFVEAARRIQVMCFQAGALFFVNDRVDVAAALGCEVHLGFNDLDVESARKILGAGAIIGYSPESTGEAREAVDDGADYLGIGPVFDTPTKADAGPAIGIDGLAAVCAMDMAPVIAVGGIKPGTAREVAAAGAAGIAVVTAVTRAGDMAAAVESLLDSFKEGEKRRGSIGDA
jgi:thiamine-phosphate pyrophosphorylase